MTTSVARNQSDYLLLVQKWRSGPGTFCGKAVRLPGGVGVWSWLGRELCGMAYPRSAFLRSCGYAARSYWISHFKFRIDCLNCWPG